MPALISWSGVSGPLSRIRTHCECDCCNSELQPITKPEALGSPWVGLRSGLRKEPQAARMDPNATTRLGLVFKLKRDL